MISKATLSLFALSSLSSIVACASGPTTPLPTVPPSVTETTVSGQPAVEKPVSNPPSTTPAVTGAPFAASLHGAILKGRSGNFVYSPASIAMALSMAREGARGETANVMDKALGANARTESKALLAKVGAPGSNGPNEVRVANRIFADGKTTFEPAFMDLTKNDWRAPAESLDFRGHPDAGRVRINGWVAGETKDKIKDLLAPGTIDDQTRMVLVNAVYMKAQWSTAFNVDATKPAPFWTSATASKQAPTMHGRVDGTLGDHAGAHVLQLPYVPIGNLSLAMVAIVPDAKDGLAALEQAYAKEGIEPFVKSLARGGKIEVTMPKFKVKSGIELGEALGALGMGQAFTDAADFSGMSKTPLQISKVVHQAFADVDEKGTEAAAATAVIMMAKSSIEIPMNLSFVIDRPFLFFVREANTGAVMFAGRVTDPTT